MEHSRPAELQCDQGRLPQGDRAGWKPSWKWKPVPSCICPHPPCLRAAGVLLGGRYECGFSASVSLGQDKGSKWATPMVTHSCIQTPDLVPGSWMVPRFYLHQSIERRMKRRPSGVVGASHGSPVEDQDGGVSLRCRVPSKEAPLPAGHKTM